MARSSAQRVMKPAVILRGGGIPFAGWTRSRMHLDGRSGYAVRDWQRSHSFIQHRLFDGCRVRSVHARDVTKPRG